MGETIKVTYILEALKKHIFLIVVTTIIFTVATASYANYVTPKLYRADAKLILGKDEERAVEYEVSDMVNYQDLLSTYVQMLKTKQLVKDSIADTKYENADVKEILASMEVTTVENTRAIKISYSSDDPEKSADILGLIVDTFSNKSTEIDSDVKAIIIDHPIKPTYPYSDSTKINIVVALIIGVLVSLGIVFLLERNNDTFNDRQKLEEEIGIQVIGTISHFNN